MEMIGRYRITGRIGSGSFATVYRGQDDTLDVPVAVKVLADNWSTNDDVRARFLAEARLLRRLSDSASSASTTSAPPSGASRTS